MTKDAEDEMKKINISIILKIVKEIMKNACIIFTAMIFFVAILGYTVLLSETMNTYTVLISFVYAIVISASYKIFAIKVLPDVSKHIMFFALVYIGFIFMYMPAVNKNMNPNSTLYLTVGFVVIYLIGFGIVQLTKQIIRNKNDKKQTYENQFDKLKK